MAARIAPFRNTLVFPRGYTKLDTSRYTGVDPKHPLSRGLIGFWPLGDSRFTAQRDLGPLGINAALTANATALNITPFGGNSLTIGVANFPQVTNSIFLNLAGPVSLVAWVLNANNYAAGNRIFGCLSGSPFNGYEIGSNGGNSYFQTGNAGTLALADYSTSNLVSNVWYHFVGTYDGSNGAFYQNGFLGGAFSGASNAIGATSQPLNFCGTSPNDGGNEITGLIFGFRVYNRALSQDEVNWLYVEPMAGAISVPASFVGISSVAPAVLMGQILM